MFISSGTPESRRAYGTAVSGASELNNSQSPKSNRLDFQTCNVRFTKSDRTSTARQLCQKGGSGNLPWKTQIRP